MAAILSRPHCVFVFVFVFDELYLYLYLYLIRFLPVYLYLYLYLKLRKKMYLYLYLYLVKRIWPQPCQGGWGLWLCARSGWSFLLPGWHAQCWWWLYGCCHCYAGGPGVSFEKTFLCSRQLRWFGCVMCSNCEINRVRSRPVPGRKGPGRLKKTCEECVKQDLKVCGLSEAGTQDRVSWRSSVKNSQQEPTPSNGSAPQSMLRLRHGAFWGCAPAQCSTLAVAR